MVKKDQIGPRIPADLKGVFKRHLERERGGYKGPLGEEIEQAIENWLAVYYLANKEARADVPDDDRQLIEKAIETHSYDINRASDELRDSSTPFNGDKGTLAKVASQSDSTIQWEPEEPVSELEDESVGELLDAAQTIQRVLGGEQN